VIDAHFDMSSATLGYSLAGKDAAAKEREDRLLAAKKKVRDRTILY